MIKIGFVVKDLAPSQLSYFLTDSLNKSCSETFDEDYLVFAQNKSTKTKPNNFSIINSAEIWGFDGILIATCVPTATEVMQCVNAAKKYFYIWDLEWCRAHLMGMSQRRDYAKTVRAFSHPSMNLIARSESHSRVIKNYCGKDVCGIVDDFNMQDFKQVITNEICRTE